MQWDDRVGRRLRLKDLHTLQTVAAVGSMAKASERLALSQPAISKAISDMEQTLGAPLFDRSSNAQGSSSTKSDKVCWTSSICPTPPEAKSELVRSSRSRG
jgi:molybdenum-dependent DNA-binding transcriptional regulator ModE